MSEVRWDLPDSWAWASAGDIARIVGGGTPSTKIDENFAEVGIPWLTPADLTGYEQAYISRGRRDLSEIGFASCGAQMLPAGSVLFSSRAPVGYCVIASNEVSTNQGFKSFVLEGGVIPEYVRHYLLSAKEYAESKASGTTFLELSGKRVAELAVPIAPLPEQRRIVEKVDGLTARTARARKDLDRIPTLIARYKQRFLELAFSGELSSGSDKKAFQDKSFSDAILSTFYGPRFGKDAYIEDGIPTLRTTDFDDAGNVVPKTPPTVAVSSKEFAKWGLEDGDILVTRTGSIGKCAVYDESIGPALPSAYLIRVRVDRSKLVPKFALLFLLSGNGQKQLGLGTTAVAQPNINAKVIEGIQLPLPSLDTQAKVIRDIENAFTWLDRLAADHVVVGRLLPKLDAAILDKAFRGELVPQDPNDEPASELLKRIEAERAAAPKKTRISKSKGKQMTGKKTPLKDQILADSTEWPAAGLDFSELSARISAPYDDMRTALFDLLGGPSPTLKQQFDSERETIVIQRIAA